MNPQPKMACTTPVLEKTAAEQLSEGCLQTAGEALTFHGVTTLHT